jgi:acyl carrier protein
MQNAFDLMTRILQEKFKVARAPALDADINEIGLDSLDVINFLFALEEETGVRIPDEVVRSEGLHTLGDFAGYLAKNSGAPAAAAMAPARHG